MGIKGKPAQSWLHHVFQLRSYKRVIALMVVLWIIIQSSSLNSPKTSSSSRHSHSMATKDPFELAKKQSFGFFEDISTANWNKLRDLLAKGVSLRHRRIGSPVTTPCPCFSRFLWRCTILKPTTPTNSLMVSRMQDMYLFQRSTTFSYLVFPRQNMAS